MKELEARRAEPEAIEAQRLELTSGVSKLTQELERAAGMVFGGTAPATIVQVMHQKEAERIDLQAKLEPLNGPAIESEGFDLGEFLTEVEEVLDDLRAALEADPVAGRQTLRKLLVGPIKITPTDDGFTFEGLSSFQSYDPADLAGPVGMRDQEVTGRIDRRVQRLSSGSSAPYLRRGYRTTPARRLPCMTLFSERSAFVTAT